MYYFPYNKLSWTSSTPYYLVCSLFIIIHFILSKNLTLPKICPKLYTACCRFIQVKRAIKRLIQAVGISFLMKLRCFEVILDNLRCNQVV